MSLPLKILLWLSAAVGFCAGVKLTMADWNADKLAQAAAVAKAVQAARTDEQQNAKRMQDAQSNQVAKLRIVERDSAGTLSELASLRDALRAKPTGDASTAALTERADTLGKLLDSCSAEYQSVARAADGHALDVITLRDAWPR